MFHPLTSRLIMIAGLFAALVLVGCGGSDSGADNALRADLEVLQEDFDDLQADLKEAQDDLKEAEEAKGTAEDLAKDAAEDLVDAQSGIADAIANAQRERDEARRQAQTLEANQRAEKLKAAFPGGDLVETVLPAIDEMLSRATRVPITVPTRGRLTLTRGGYRTATLSGSGTRSATMALTSGADSGKTVVYTDRQLSRLLLDHYGDQRDEDDMTRFDVGPDAGLLAITGGEISQTSMQWRISHGVRTSVGAVENPEDDIDTRDTLPEGSADLKRADSYLGSLHGIQGRFVCSGANCQVQITPNYPDEPTKEQFELGSVTVSSVTPDGDGTFTLGGMLHFSPNGSPPIQLYEGGPVGADAEYMVFGYWREDPTSPAADYEVGVFAKAFGTGTSPTAPITAMYDGTAVGMYVEQDPTNSVDTHRQGEFVADVDLSINNNSAVDTLTGTIDDFVTTPTGGSAAPRTSARWVVRLRDRSDSNNDDRTAVIDNLAGVKSGSWEYSFVPAHANAADNTPPAVTGTFNTRIEDFVHLLGAFGADKR